MTTAIQLIESGALKLGAINSGEALTASEASDCLGIMNSMLDYWSINKYLVYQIVQTQYTWAASQRTRTIGTGGDLNGARPVRIEEGTFFRDNNNIDYQVEILRDRASYDSLVSKGDTSTFPGVMFYDTAFPLGSLYVYPVPSGALTLFLSHWQTLQSFAALTTNLSLPPGYQWVIEHNLGVALSPVFSIPPSPTLVREADRSLRSMMRINHIPVLSKIEVPAVLRGMGRSDIKAGA